MAARSESHLIDHDGLVGCTRRGHDVTVGVCLGCSELLAVVASDTGPTEIRCRPAPRPASSAGPWSLLGGGFLPDIVQR
ncbi:MAG: hypothetical protein JJT89_18470 [Nitriliruptoraceae bacterium]|nr:hypothetical protein [Nitriliruptoraceae bacterium]